MDRARALTKTTSDNCVIFFIRNILIRFGLPTIIITDNGTQFTDKNFQKIMSDLAIKHRLTSMEHPQTNGQAEAANRVILQGLKRRLEKPKGN